MKRVGFLFEQVTDFNALCLATRRAAAGKHASLETAAFLLNLETEVLQLRRELLDASYHPQPYRVFTLHDPKERTISVAAFRDRVVHHSLCSALAPVLDRYAVFDSYACREGKGNGAAVLRAQHLSRQFPFFLKLDVLRFFETADHDVLKGLLRRLIKDPRALWLTDLFIDHGAPGSAPGQGLPIGNLTSQHFANLYLGPLDHYVKEVLRIPGYCRYMDDLLSYGQGRTFLVEAGQAITQFLDQRLKLTVKESATRFGPIRSGVPFLGFRIWTHQLRLDGSRARRFRRKVREQCVRFQQGAIADADWARSVSSLCGWAEQADTLQFRRSFFRNLEESGMLPD